MSINVKNPEAEALIADLKRRTGKGTTDLLLDLLRRETARLEEHFNARVSRAMEANRQIRERWTSRPAVDPQPIHEIPAYDEDGLPT